MFDWLSNDNYTEEAITAKPSESIKSKQENLVQVAIWPLQLEARDWEACSKQSPANKPQNHVQPATPTKSAKLHAKTFNILISRNGSQWCGCGWGKGWGRVILRIFTGNNDINFNEENQNPNIRQLLSNTMY